MKTLEKSKKPAKGTKKLKDTLSEPVELTEQELEMIVGGGPGEGPIPFPFPHPTCFPNRTC